MNTLTQRHELELLRVSKKVQKRYSIHPTLSRSNKKSLALPSQFLDKELLSASPLYLKSRKIFIQNKGAYKASLNSSERSLSSSSLLTHSITYTPHEDELNYLLYKGQLSHQASSKANRQKLFNLLSYSVSVFHEQSHRILSTFLPAPKTLSPSQIRMSLNLWEALVIVMDQALSDQLCETGYEDLAKLGYLTGVLYDPGIPKLKNKLKLNAIDLKSRDYRNYLQVALHATFLLLEGHAPARIAKVLPTYFMTFNPKLIHHSINRALRLDSQFVERTNPYWQKKHFKEVKKAYLKLPQTMKFSEDPAQFIEPYLLAEKWFDLMIR